MAALVRPLLAVLLLLGAVLAAQGRRHSRYLLTSNSQRELLKEAGNEIDHGPGYTSQHKQHQWQKTGHKGHAWANKFKGGLKKRRFGHPGEHLPANTNGKRQDTRAMPGLTSSRVGSRREDLAILGSIFLPTPMAKDRTQGPCLG